VAAGLFRTCTGDALACRPLLDAQLLPQVAGNGDNGGHLLPLRPGAFLAQRLAPLLVNVRPRDRVVVLRILLELLALLVEDRELSL